MTDRTVRHASFTIERVYDASPATVFAAWADVDAKRRWFVEGDGENWETLDYAMDFRVGGSEYGRFRFKGKTVHGNETVFLDIVPDRRIVLAYSMSLDDQRISASLGTVDLVRSGGGTRLIYTEQGAFFDGLDTPEPRKEGWNWLLDRLDAELRRQAA